MKAGITVLALVVGCGLIGCADREIGLLPGGQPSSTYVGRVAGTDALFALVVDEYRAGGYSCGGDDTLSSHTEWFMGESVVRHGDSLFIDCGLTSVTAYFGDGEMTGFITDRDGVEWPWTATQPRPGTLTGLYAAPDPKCATGAIVLQDDATSAPLVQGAWCNGAGDFYQVTPMDPIQLSEDGLAVEVEFDDPLQLYLRPFEL